MSGESQNKGSVSSSVYLAYIKSGGSVASMLLLFALFLLAQVFYSSCDVWLKEWSVFSAMGTYKINFKEPAIRVGYESFIGDSNDVVTTSQ